MTKDEIYKALIDDGAKITKSVRFISKNDLVEMYTERFGRTPEEDASAAEEHPNPASEEGPEEEHPNPASEEGPEIEIKQLRFLDSGWCSVLNRGYSRGLYRPKSREEYLALKPYACEEC